MNIIAYVTIINNIPKNPLKTPCILMINTIPGGIFEHADDWLLHANPGFFSNSFEAPSPTFGGGVLVSTGVIDIPGFIPNTHFVREGKE